MDKKSPPALVTQDTDPYQTGHQTESEADRLSGMTWHGLVAKAGTDISLPEEGQEVADDEGDKEGGGGGL